MHQQTVSRKVKTTHKRKYLEITYLIMVLYPEYLRNPLKLSNKDTQLKHRYMI